MASQRRKSYVTLAVAAEQHGVSQRTIRRWIAQGRLTGYRVGPRAIRVEASELDQLARPIPTTGHSARYTA